VTKLYLVVVLYASQHSNLEYANTVPLCIIWCSPVSVQMHRMHVLQPASVACQLPVTTRKPCCRKETARCRSCSYWC